MLDFKNKTVFLTGAAYGIGAAFARYFHSKGANLVLVDIAENELNRQVEELRAAGADPHVYISDIGKIEERIRIRDDLEAKGLQVDVLINNVGIGYWKPLHEIDWERLEEVIDVNVKATTHFVWMFLPQMLSRDEGVIINLASTGSFCGASNAAVYTGTKAYIHNFTEALDMETYNTGVRVLSAYPGATDTHFWEDAGTVDSEMYKKAKLMSSEDTVAEFMTALQRGKKQWIAGANNRRMVFLSQFVPRELLKKLAIRKYS